MPKKSSDTIRVCYVLSYKAPNYTRTATLVAALQSLPNVELTVIKNHATGIARYWQTLTQLAKYRMNHKPDVFLLGFRGQEVFWLLWPFMLGSRIIFDEFINLHDYFVSEHHKLREGSLPVKLMDAYMRWVVRRCDHVLEDTPAHVALSSTMYGTPVGKIVDIPVGAEESVFKPQDTPKKTDTFEVFFYGNLLPLHGMTVILDAIKQLATDDKLANMHFTLVGGKGKPDMMEQVRQFIAESRLEPYVTHVPWVEYAKLPDYIAVADVCLGGPFGNTGQARRVITGKTFQFMAMAKPVIIGETENTGLFTDKKDCLVVPQNDAIALATALSWCQTHVQNLPTIAKNARKLYETSFSIVRIGTILRELLGV